MLSKYRNFRNIQRLKTLVDNSTSLRIVIGAGGVFETGWITTEIEHLDILNNKHWERLFRKKRIDCILGEHVWEHLTIAEGRSAARNCYQYLKPGGYLRVAVPDGFQSDREYLEWVKVGGIGPGAKDHKMLYNYKTLTQLFEQVGFDVKLLEYFDSENKFHFVDWDVCGGKIHRSMRFDERNINGILKYTSIILDAYKNTKKVDIYNLYATKSDS